MGRYFPYLHPVRNISAWIVPPADLDELPELEWDDDEEITLPMGFGSHSEFNSKRKEWKEKGLCPRCGDVGEWRMMALYCRKGHGKFAG
jgi:hypothetical protein